MGNCIQSSSSNIGSRGDIFAGEGRRLQELQLQGSGSGSSGEEQGASSPMPVVKVKMVLSKAELGWLVSQLKAGDRRLEDVLHDMARRKRDAGGDGWRPSLESIVECPAPETNDTAASSDD
ncbi:hypothetical protein HU200_067300 [Digitaria exilis]|uniref:Uncharacterized protein n=1 Tax=Digitaria exilis TaxID=1010633 RepID=A0A835A0U8_9POAL|nr:hypothetical protein HU200_067300 [Digitaria exilis]